jgi:hypothetical protein
VLHEEERKLAMRLEAAAAAYPDAWSGFVAACQAFLDACLDPAVRQILLLDAPSVLGMEGHREVEEAYYLTGVKNALSAAMQTGVIETQPVDALARILLGAINEAGALIANANDEKTARNQASAVVTRILSGLKVSKK